MTTEKCKECAKKQEALDKKQETLDIMANVLDHILIKLNAVPNNFEHLAIQRKGFLFNDIDENGKIAVVDVAKSLDSLRSDISVHLIGFHFDMLKYVKEKLA